MHDDIGKALTLIFQGIKLLQGCCTDGRQFTIDGRLVGDIGELVAAREFDIVLDKTSRATHDAKTRVGSHDVQIKATFKDSLTLTKEPELYIGLKLSADGGHEVIFNGPGSVLRKRFEHRKNFGEKQLSFSIKHLRDLDKSVPPEQRVPLKHASF